VILLLVPVLCAVVGVVLYGALRATGAFGVFASADGASSSRVSRGRSSAEPSSIRERVQNIAPGWLWAVVATAAIWILGWLIILLVGLSLLT
jgi:hypothetical protein